MHKKGWFLFIGMFCFLSARGQGLQSIVSPYIRSFTPADYGAQNQNWSISQGKNDWIYVANNEGILEFDGSSWRLYKLPDQQTPRSVYADTSGRVFTGGFEAFGMWTIDSRGSMVYIPLEEKLPQKEEIWHIVPIGEGVFCQSFSMAMVYGQSEVNNISLPGNSMFLHKVNGKYFFQLIDGELYEFIYPDKFTLLPGTEKLSMTNVSFILPGPGNHLLIGTANHGLFMYETGNLSAWKHPLNEEFRKYQLNKAVQLSDGGYALGTILQGVYILDDNLELSYRINKQHGLQNNTVLSLLEDKAGNLWVGMDKGLDLIELSNPFRYFTDQVGSIGSVYASARKGDLFYIGSNQGVYYTRITDENPIFRLIPGTQGQVWSLEDHGVIICGHNAGTFIIDGVQATMISDVTGGWNTTPTPGNDNVLIQGVYTGLLRYKKTASGRWLLDKRLEGFSEAIRTLMFDKSGNLWVAHPKKGVYRLTLDDNFEKIIHIRSFGKSDGLDQMYKLRLFNWQGQVALQGENIYVYNDQTDSFQLLEDSVIGRYQPNVWMYNRDSLWFLSKVSELIFGTGKTVHRVFDLRLIPEYEHIKYFNELGGEGRYVFSLENGFATLSERALLGLKNNKITPGKLLIRKAEASNKTQDTFSRIHPGTSISYQLNSITFYFAQARFDRPPLYSYRLRGLNDEWNPPSTQSFASFQNLPPGNYILELRSDFDSEILSFPFSIKRPWYANNWAFFTYMLFAFLIFYSIVRYFSQKLERQKELYEQSRKEAERIQKEQETRLRLQQEIQLKSRELAHSTLSLIQKNEVLMDLKNRLSEVLDDNPKTRSILRQIDEHIDTEQDWDGFVEVFNNVHDDFFKKLQVQYPELTPGDLRLAAYLRLNLSTKEIAPLLNISVRGVENKRYRLRKKMGLSEDSNLTEYIMGI